MSLFAYLDKERTQEVYATKCNIEDQTEKTYYCQDSECNATLYLRSVNGSRAANFYAHGANPHTGWCRFLQFIHVPTNYDINSFKFSNFLKNIIVEPKALSNNSQSNSSSNTYPSGDGKLILPKTIGNLYYLCKTHSHLSKIGDTPVWKILYDIRCNKIITKGIFGSRLIECRYERPSLFNDEIILKYPLSPTLPNQYTIVIKFSDKRLFKHIQDKISTKKSYPIVVGGDWSKRQYNVFECTIMNKDQIFIPKVKSTKNPNDNPSQ